MALFTLPWAWTSPTLGTFPPGEASTLSPPKKQARRTPATGSTKGLASRVSALEADVVLLRGSMVAIATDVQSLKLTVHQMDERTVRGEKLMLMVQLEQRRIARTIDAIADKLEVVHTPLPPTGTD
jgi:hypothetical protein